MMKAALQESLGKVGTLVCTNEGGILCFDCLQTAREEGIAALQHPGLSFVSIV